MIRRLFCSRLFVFFMSMVLIGFFIGYAYTVKMFNSSDSGTIKIPFLIKSRSTER